MATLTLPTADGSLAPYTVQNTPLPRPASTRFNRVAFAAAHVVVDPLRSTDPWQQSAIDWESTIAFRRHLWGLGLGVAEAMDTAQRGMGLSWPEAQDLIRRSLAAARAENGLIACGVGTDHLLPRPGLTLADIIAAYEEQLAMVEGEGGRVILMASRALAAIARGPDDYLHVYGHLLSQVKQPVILHWLGDMFDPALVNYWGHAEIGAAMRTCLALIQSHASKVDGIKISLLSAAREIEMRAQLPAHVRMYTGDDFNYADLIAGDGERHSDALLGIFDPIAPAAAAGLAALAAGDMAAYRQILDPTVALSRHIFAAPTRFYKTGVVFLAWLNGFQPHFHMLGGQQSARSVAHFAEIFRLADQSRMLADPDLATRRMAQLLALAGVAA